MSSSRKTLPAKSFCSSNLCWWLRILHLLLGSPEIHKTSMLQWMDFVRNPIGWCLLLEFNPTCFPQFLSQSHSWSWFRQIVQFHHPYSGTVGRDLFVSPNKQVSWWLIYVLYFHVVSRKIKKYSTKSTTTALERMINQSEPTLINIHHPGPSTWLVFQENSPWFSILL